MSEAPRVPFSSLYKVPSRNGVSYPSRLRGSGVSMVNMRELFAFDRIGSQEMERVPLTARERSDCLLQEGDLLFARQSLVREGAGRVVYVDKGPDRTWEGHLIRVRLDRSKALPKYFFYYFRSPQGRAEIATIVEQVAAAGIRGSDLARLNVPLPSLPHQEAIAEILSALDDKIECNRSLVQLLRQVSSAQFERVLSAAETNVEFTALKPTVEGRRFVKTGPFGSLLHASDYAETGTPLILVKHVANGLILRDGLPRVSADRSHELKEYYLAPEDIVVTRVGRVGDAAIIHSSQSGWLFSGQMLRVRLDPKFLEPYWVFGYMLTRLFRDHIDSYAVGSTRQSLSVQLLESIPVPVVPMDLQRHFADLVRPLWGLTEALRVESDRLAGLRDTLLPGLLSGAIRARTSESSAEEAV